MINYHRALSSLLNKNLTGFRMIFSIFFILSIALLYESTIQKKAMYAQVQRTNPIGFGW